MTIPERKDVKESDKWDLSGLYSTETEWESDLSVFTEMISRISSFKGKLSESAETLKECLDFMNNLELLEEKLGSYAHLRLNEDEGNGAGQERFARYMSAAAKASSEASYQTPEIQAVPDEKMNGFLKDPLMSDYVIMLRKILRFKPHILSEKEEKLLAMQAESNQTASKAFSALTNVDMTFGTITTAEGEVPLTQSTFSSFLIDPDRETRRKAYFQFYDGFSSHKNTLASLYAGSVHLDIYKARVRGWNTALEAALFPDKVPVEVYSNLVTTVGDSLPDLHRYYDLRRRIMGLDKLAHYDVYAPLVPAIRVKHTYDEAVKVISEALQPLGEEYVSTLAAGLSGGWVDRYENKGKRSGAFSAGGYTGEPYILMNYKEDVLRDVFTLAHEGGHSMHSWYSVRNNPFQHYSYTIFEAEVASTFNEQLLAGHLYAAADDDAMRAYLIGKQVDDIIATIFRQTMFAEFELKCHTMVESGVPLSVDSLTGEYRKLLEKYFGPDVELFDFSSLEGLRIPHFYRAFYVYKYATGLAAAVALSERVLSGGEAERNDYLGFLKSGGSKYPLESLATAGVDMSSPEPVKAAMARFRDLTDRLEGLLL